MSSQKGNAIRTRSQKHQNKRVFKNDLHDTNIRTKRINQIQITNVCAKCKNILEWKIKYKKYKLLKAPKTCNKCQQKAIKSPYHTVCLECAYKLGVCPKCEARVQRFDEKENENDATELKTVADDFEELDYDSDEDCVEDFSKLEVKS